MTISHYADTSFCQAQIHFDIDDEGFCTFLGADTFINGKWLDCHNKIGFHDDVPIHIINDINNGFLEYISNFEDRLEEDIADMECDRILYDY